MVKEISFPRGGRKPSTELLPLNTESKYNLFGGSQKKISLDKSKKIRPQNQLNGVVKLKTIEPFVPSLTEKCIQDDMVLIGCIRNIQRVSLKINIPGRLQGIVFINNISNSYTTLIQSALNKNKADEYPQLNELFSLGECVSLKVLNSRHEKVGISLSMNPQDINSNIAHYNIQKGMILWGAIHSCEEHGYIVDLGINNCRAFLNKKNCSPETKYLIGQTLWFGIEDCNVCTEATNVILTTVDKDIKKMKVHEISFDHLLPGMKVDLTISKVLKNGIQGTILDNFEGYIHENQFPHKFYNKNKYVEEEVLEARIIYIMPITKIVFLTLKYLEPRNAGCLKDGDLLKCKVVKCLRQGITIKLGDYKGFVSYRRLQNDIKPQINKSDFDIIKQVYRKGSVHKCRVLLYDYFDEMYICTVEKALVKSHLIYSLNDLIPGQFVSAEVKEIQNSGLLVQIDFVSGFIKNEHIYDGILRNYSHIKTKYKLNSKVSARVWTIDLETNNLQLTMKPTLIKTDNILFSYDQLENHKQYPGVVKQVSSKGVVIKFFGNVTGWVPNKYINPLMVHNIEQSYKIGQLVNCTVVRYNEANKLILSLLSPEDILEKPKKVKKSLLGQRVNGTVSQITQAGIEVQIDEWEPTRNTGIIPLLYTTKFPILAKLIAGMYMKGDEIKNLVCVSIREEVATLSRRDFNLIENNIPLIKNLTNGTILPSSLLNIQDDGIVVEVPIKNYNKPIFIENKSAFIENVIPKDKLILNQLIFVKILSVKPSIRATTKLSYVWDYDQKYTVQYLSEYFDDVAAIRKQLKATGNPLANLNLGEQITGVIKSKSKDGSLILQLKNSVKAVVRRELQKGNELVGNEVKVIILWCDFVENYAEVVICPKIIHKINPTQDGVINIPEISDVSEGDKQPHMTHAEILLIKEDFALGVLRGKVGRKQFIFFPMKLHPNDFATQRNSYQVGDYVKAAILSFNNGIIIGLLKNTMKEICKKNLLNLKSKRKLSDSDINKKLQTKRLKLNSETVSVNSTNNSIKLQKKEAESEKECKLEKNMKIKKKKTEENDKKTKDENVRKRKINDTTLEKVVDKSSIKLKQVQNIESGIKKTKNEQIKKQKIENSKLKMVIEKPSNKLKQVQNNKSITKTKEEHLKKRKVKESSEELSKEFKQEQQNNEKVSTNKEFTSSEPLILLPGANDFWNISAEKPHEESSDDDDDDEKVQSDLLKLQKKKKMTPAERAEAARLEEERIRKIELELADSSNIPKTADQFERLLLASPNNSKLWINYMAFHLESTEIEKARAVARKAISKIEFREEQEKLNIWIALLNLENRYGTNESFINTLEEAVKLNDSLTVYLQALNILSDSKKIVEFTELLRTVLRKFKSEFKMWVVAAEACYKCDLKDQARDLMQRSLKSLPESQHVNLLVRFAFMENNHNDSERAEALLEKILASYPRRVDIWTSYVDMLIKNNKVHIARNVLERSVKHSLPARKMKTLFTKYVEFESKFGDNDSIQNVKKLAANYVKNALQ